MIALVVVVFHTQAVFHISDYFVTEYLVDNTLGFLFIAFISYQVLAINNSALDKAEDSINETNREVEKNRELNRTLEMKVIQRTGELVLKNEALENEIAERNLAEANLKATQKKLIEVPTGLAWLT